MAVYRSALISIAFTSIWLAPPATAISHVEVMRDLVGLAEQIFAQKYCHDRICLRHFVLNPPQVQLPLSPASLQHFCEGRLALAPLDGFGLDPEPTCDLAIGWMERRKLFQFHQIDLHSCPSLSHCFHWCLRHRLSAFSLCQSNPTTAPRRTWVAALVGPQS
jgi:hypothetical protein